MLAIKYPQSLRLFLDVQMESLRIVCQADVDERRDRGCG
jgi:hypothetical protein